MADATVLRLSSCNQTFARRRSSDSGAVVRQPVRVSANGTGLEGALCKPASVTRLPRSRRSSCSTLEESWKVPSILHSPARRSGNGLNTIITPMAVEVSTTSQVSGSASPSAAGPMPRMAHGLPKPSTPGAVRNSVSEAQSKLVLTQVVQQLAVVTLAAEASMSSPRTHATTPTTTQEATAVEGSDTYEPSSAHTHRASLEECEETVQAVSRQQVVTMAGAVVSERAVFEQGTSYAAVSEQGPEKSEMQDRHVHVADLSQVSAPGNNLGHSPGGNHNHGSHSSSNRNGSSRPSVSLFGVFDGHSGSKAASHAAKHMAGHLVGHPHFWKALDAVHHAQHVDQSATDVMTTGLQRVFKKLDDAIIDTQRMLPSLQQDGTTAVIGLLSGNHLIVAGVGDSRAVLSRAGHAVRLSVDHVPKIEAESRRCEAAGATIKMHKGTLRVCYRTPAYTQKLLSVSRALGDLDLKEPKPIISCEPDVSHVVLQPEHDKFVIYASDGLWGVMEDQAAVQLAQEAIEKAASDSASPSEAAQHAARELLAAARRLGSPDDVTIMVQMLQ